MKYEWEYGVLNETDNALRWMLCTYHPLSPDYNFYLDGVYDGDEEALAAAHKECECSACFYGRHELALEIIRLRGVVNLITGDNQ